MLLYACITLSNFCETIGLLFSENCSYVILISSSNQRTTVRGAKKEPRCPKDTVSMTLSGASGKKLIFMFKALYVNNGVQIHSFTTFYAYLSGLRGTISPPRKLCRQHMCNYASPTSFLCQTINPSLLTPHSMLAIYLIH